MPDIAIVDPAVHAAPKSYTIKGSQEIILKGVTASFDGTGAGTTWVPAVQVISDSGVVIGTYTLGSALAAGASADVSWFPGIGGAAGQSVTTAQFDLKIVADTSALLLADNQLVFAIPSDLNNLSLTDAQAYVTTVSSAGLPTVQVRNATTGFDMLSTPITIDVGEFTSYTAATPPVIDPTHQAVSTGNLIAIDVDAIGTSALGLGVILTFG